MKKRWKALIVAIVVIAAAFYFEHRDTSLPLSAENKTILLAADNVNAARTVGFVKDEANSPSPRPEAFYEKDTNSVPVPPAVAMRIVEILTSKERQSDMHPACIYTPGFVLTFIHEKKSIDVFFCFECGGIIMKAANDPIPREMGLILNAHTELLNIFKKLFPNDPAVQKL